jgi:hypothetical protein
MAAEEVTYKQIDLEGYLLDDNDLKEIMNAAQAKAAAHHISILGLAGLLHDLNVYGVKHDLRWGRDLSERFSAENKEEETN